MRSKIGYFLFFACLQGPSASTLSRNSSTESLIRWPEHGTVYRSIRDEVKSRMQQIGALAYKLIKLFDDISNDQYQLLRWVFEEQYKVVEEEKIELRPKEEISSSSVQSPHDHDGAYRQKGEQKAKGYSTNVTETASDGPLNLVTNIDERPANTPDTQFVQPSIEATIQVTEPQYPFDKVC